MFVGTAINHVSSSLSWKSACVGDTNVCSITMNTSCINLVVNFRDMLHSAKLRTSRKISDVLPFDKVL